MDLYGFIPARLPSSMIYTVMTKLTCWRTFTCRLMARSMWLGWLRNGEWRTEPDFTELWRPRSGFCDFSFLLAGFWRDLKLWKYHENIWKYLGIPRNATRCCYCKYITRTLHEIGIDRPQKSKNPVFDRFWMFLKLYNYRDPDFWGAEDRSFLHCKTLVACSRCLGDAVPQKPLALSRLVSERSRRHRGPWGSLWHTYTPATCLRGYALYVTTTHTRSWGR